MAAADATFTKPSAPTIAYAHGNQGPYNQLATLNAWTGLREWLIDNGWAWFESAGGGNQWGSPTGVAAYDLAYAWAATRISIGKLVFLGRSMGGAYARTLGVSIGGRAVDGTMINSGVLDLAARGAPGTGDQPAMWSAFGASDHDDYLAKIAAYDPMRAPVGRWTKPVMQLWGTADTVVPPSINATAWNQKYGPGLGALLTTDVRAGGDHSGTNGSYLQVPAMTAWLAQFGGTPQPPAGRGLRVRRAYLIEPTGDRRELALR